MTKRLSQAQLMEKFFDEHGYDTLGEPLGECVTIMKDTVNKTIDASKAIKEHAEDIQNAHKVQFETMAVGAATNIKSGTLTQKVLSLQNDPKTNTIAGFSFKANKGRQCKTMIVITLEAIEALVELKSEIDEEMKPKTPKKNPNIGGKGYFIMETDSDYESDDEEEDEEEDEYDEEEKPKKKNKKKTVTHKHINLGGIPKALREKVREYHEEYIQGWVHENCGQDEESKDNKDAVQASWLQQLKSIQGGSCYRNLLPGADEGKVKLEVKKFTYWLCKINASRVNVEQFAAAVNSTKYIQSMHDKFDEAVQKVDVIAEETRDIDKMIKDKCVAHLIEVHEDRKRLTNQLKAETGPARSTRARTKLVAKKRQQPDSPTDSEGSNKRQDTKDMEKTPIEEIATQDPEI